MKSEPGRWASAWRRSHGVEYAAEAFGLGLFMMAACAAALVLEHPDSWVRQQVSSALMRRILAGLAMGGTLVGLVYSPWGRRSGAHLNPIVTLVFAALGKVAPRDVAGYITAQFLGGAAGVAIMAAFAGRWLADPAVRFVVTTPGSAGIWPAFVAETLISAIMISAVLLVSRSPRWSRYAGGCAACLLCLFIVLESPLSGTSMNPARTVASALASGDWTGGWVYFTAPALGMFTAAWGVTRGMPESVASCAKLCHDERFHCVFCERRAQAPVPVPAVIASSRV